MLINVRISTVKRVIVFCTVLLFFGAQVQASSLTEVLDTAERLGLASHPTWLKLLHYERNGKQSEVLTDSFFLSLNGRIDPNAELNATIKAYFAPWDDNVNEHARCRFPARYFWIFQQMSLPDYSLNDGKCPKLENWALFDSVKSVSIFLVSGYLGNPASTFGHALLKLNTDSIDDRSGLFDLALNYGALIPENENTLLYVAQGLFGGYEAGFSDRYFYTQDLVYSRTEFRDIWDFRLALSDYERKLLILHIWEIAGKKFNYYFLDENCVYRLAELLELVIEEEILDNARFWYIPTELFHSLNDIDKARRESGRRGLIQSVSFIPSSQRELYHKLKLLTPDELKAFNEIIREGIDSMSGHLAEFLNDRQIMVLDGLLAYQQYRLVAEEPNPSRERMESKDKILLARLQLPARKIPELKIPKLPSPASGLRPMEIGFSIAVESSKEFFLRLHWSPHKKELTGQNSLEGNELVLFDIAIGVFEERHKIFVDKLDLVRVVNLNAISIPAEEENKWSWKLRVGTDRIEKNGEDRYDGVVSFGAGHMWKFNETLSGYGMVDLGAHTQTPIARLRPHMGIIYSWEAMQALLYFGAESVNYNADFTDVLGGQINYQLSDRYAVRVEVSNETATRTSIGLNSYW